MPKIKLIVGPDGKKMTVGGKKVGRPKGKANDGSISHLKNDLFYVYKQCGGRVKFLAWAKKDPKNWEKVITWMVNLLPKEILTTNTEKTEIHIIDDATQSIIDKLRPKPTLAVDNDKN